MDWNKLLRQSVEEFRQPRRLRRSLMRRVGFGVLVSMVLFVCWLVNREAQSYLVLSSLFSIAYGLYVLQKA